MQICWPGADWKSILPMLDRGGLPHLRNLIDKGVVGKLRSVQPRNQSSVWASVATGKYPHCHGVVSDLEPADGSQAVFRPVSRYACTARTLWHILSQQGRRSLVVGWPATFPAEQIAGAIITPEFVMTDWRGKAPFESVTPFDLADELADLRIHPSEIDGLDLVAFVPKLAQLREAKDPRLSQLAEHVAQAATLQAIAVKLMQTRNWEYASIYFSSVYEIAKGFVNYQAPKTSFVSDSDFDMFQNVVEASYFLHDVMLGHLSRLAGDDATILVMSDEGVHAGERRTDELAISQPEHIEPGILVMAGPEIEEDKLVYGSSILDITPTLLHLFDLPVGRDMQGKVQEAALRSKKEVHFIDSHESAGQASSCSAVIARYMKLTKQVGNSSVPDFATADTVGIQNREFLYNIAESCIAAKQEGLAIPVLKHLAAVDPYESKFLYKLMTCYIAIDKAGLARETFHHFVSQRKRFALQAQAAWKLLDSCDEDTLSLSERAWKARLWKQSRVNLAGMAFLNSWVLHACEDFVGALRAANQADHRKVFNPAALLRLRAECLIRLGRPNEAIPVFYQMLELNPDDFDADIGLAGIAFRTRRFRNASNHALDAVSKRYFNPVAHYIYGGAIFRCGEALRAADALEEAISQDPLLLGAYQRLVLLYNGPLNNPTKARIFHQRMQKAQADKDLFQRARKQGYNQEI